jgi:hypothetical protein
MSTVQQTVLHVNQDLKRKQTLKFASDEDLSLLASIYLASGEERQDILRNLQNVLRSYGFTNFERITQAPGSFFVSIKVRFGNNNKNEARRSKKELKEDLESAKLPENPAKRQAVKKLKESILQRAKRKILVLVVAGSSFLGVLAGDIAKDALKEEIEGWLKDHGPKIVQQIDGIVTADLPPDAAKEFHRMVKDYIEKSPEKTSLRLPPSE